MTTLFNYDPYYDDFDEDNNFMRVLFRPGYSVQARELTQLQTILSNQIEKFGNHIFKSGSPIIGGKVSLDKKAVHLLRNRESLGEWHARILSTIGSCPEHMIFAVAFVLGYRLSLCLV